MSKSCVICGTEESEGETLVEAPCGRHWVCPDDVASYFENATRTESLFPPQCCGYMFLLDDYEEHVPFETAWAYQVKERGEYSILAKYRVYCANPNCGQFIHPSFHVVDPETMIAHAKCEPEGCRKLTCVNCKALLDQGAEGHECRQTEDERQFRQAATEQGYKKCPLCGVTVELAEACNHITCECGNSFCYICGEDWPGLHGCPSYGRVTYDEEGFNQDGFHRDSGLNREGLTRQELRRRANEDDEEEEEEEEGEDEGEDEDDEWEVLQHVTPEQRTMINQLPAMAREDALDQIRITLFENQGIVFDQFGHPPAPPPLEELGDDGDALEDEDGDRAETDGWATDEDEDLRFIGPRPGTPRPADVDDIEEDLRLIGEHSPFGSPGGSFQGDHMDNHGFADTEFDFSGSDAFTPPVDNSGEEMDDILETGSAANSSTQAQRVPENHPWASTPDANTHELPMRVRFPTGGPYTIVARGFVSGIAIHDVEAILTRHGAQVTEGRLLSSDPVVAQVQFATQQDAEDVIATFDGRKVDGQVLDVRMEDEDL